MIIDPQSSGSPPPFYSDSKKSGYGEDEKNARGSVAGPDYSSSSLAPAKDKDDQAAQSLSFQHPYEDTSYSGTHPRQPSYYDQPDSYLNKSNDSDQSLVKNAGPTGRTSHYEDLGECLEYGLAPLRIRSSQQTRRRSGRSSWRSLRLDSCSTCGRKARRHCEFL